MVSPYSTIGYRFTSVATGVLTGLKAAKDILSPNDSAPKGVRLGRLYERRSGPIGHPPRLVLRSQHRQGVQQGQEGACLGGPSGLSLTAGTSYRLVATSQEQLVWNWVDHGVRMPNLSSTSGGAYNYGDFNAGVFSVQVGAPCRLAPVPEPATLAAMGLGLVAAARRRRAEA